MILSTMTLKYSDGNWTFARNARKNSTEIKPSAETKTLERMTLSELLYHALMGDEMQPV